VVLEYHWKVGVAPWLAEAATRKLPLMLPSTTVVAAAGWVLIVMIGAAPTVTTATLDTTGAAPGAALTTT